MAQSGHFATEFQCLLFRVKQTSNRFQIGPQLETATLPKHTRLQVVRSIDLSLHIVFVGLLIVSTEK